MLPLALQPELNVAQILSSAPRLVFSTGQRGFFMFATYYYSGAWNHGFMLYLASNPNFKFYKYNTYLTYSNKENSYLKNTNVVYLVN